MKRRHRYMLNLFSTGILLFALYLNFLKKDVVEMTSTINNEQAPPAVSENKKESKPAAEHRTAQTLVLK